MNHYCAPKLWEPTSLGTLFCPRCGRHYKIHEASMQDGAFYARYRYAKWWEMSPVIEDWIERTRGAWKCLTTSSSSSPGPASSTATASRAAPVQVRARRAADAFFVVWMLARQVFPSPRTRHR